MDFWLLGYFFFAPTGYKSPPVTTAVMRYCFRYLLCTRKEICLWLNRQVSGYFHFHFILLLFIYFFWLLQKSEKGFRSLKEVSCKFFFGILSGLKASQTCSVVERPGSISSPRALVPCLGVPAVGWLLTPNRVSPQKRALLFPLSRKLNAPAENGSSCKF